MTAQLPTGKERRRYPRQEIAGGMTVELRVEVSGEKPAVLLTRGRAIDISCGGVRCATDLMVPVGTQVAVRFASLPQGLSVSPLASGGRVVRTESLGGAPEQVAIAFSQPLRQVEFTSAQASPTARTPQSLSSGIGPAPASARAVGDPI